MLPLPSRFLQGITVTVVEGVASLHTQLGGVCNVRVVWDLLVLSLGTGIADMTAWVCSGDLSALPSCIQVDSTRATGLVSHIITAPSTRQVCRVLRVARVGSQD